MCFKTVRRSQGKHKPRTRESCETCDVAVHIARWKEHLPKGGIATTCHCHRARAQRRLSLSSFPLTPVLSARSRCWELLLGVYHGVVRLYLLLSLLQNVFKPQPCILNQYSNMILPQRSGVFTEILRMA